MKKHPTGDRAAIRLRFFALALWSDLAGFTRHRHRLIVTRAANRTAVGPGSFPPMRTAHMVAARIRMFTRPDAEAGPWDVF